MSRSRMLMIGVAVVAVLALFGTAFAAQTNAGVGQSAFLADPTPTPGAPGSQTPTTNQAFLGITVADITPQLITKFSLPAGSQGVVIAGVQANSPAATAGLKAGDIVTAVGGTSIKTAADVTAEVRKHQSGETIPVTVQRAGQSSTIQVTAGTAPTRGNAQGKAQGRALGNTLPPELQPLTQIPAGQRFSHMMGQTTTYTDANGQTITVNVIPGVVTAINTTSITIRPNNSQANGGPYGIDTTTRIQAGGRATGSDAVKVNDNVFVVVVNNGNHASYVVEAGNGGGFGFGFGGFGFGRGGFGPGGLKGGLPNMPRFFRNPNGNGPKVPQPVPTPGGA